MFLGDIRPGTHQLAVGSNMFKAPGCAYRPQRSDFLLIRQASGALLLRELTGYVAVGQQEPLMRIPTPATKDVRSATCTLRFGSTAKVLAKRMPEHYSISSFTAVACPSPQLGKVITHVSELRRTFPFGDIMPP